jgi:hypothetical protein
MVMPNVHSLGSLPTAHPAVEACRNAGDRCVKALDRAPLSDGRSLRRPDAGRLAASAGIPVRR